MPLSHQPANKHYIYLPLIPTVIEKKNDEKILITRD